MWSTKSTAQKYSSTFPLPELKTDKSGVHRRVLLVNRLIPSSDPSRCAAIKKQPWTKAGLQWWIWDVWGAGAKKIKMAPGVSVGAPAHRELWYIFVLKMGHFITFCPLEGHPRGHFIIFCPILEGTLSHLLHWKGSLEGTLSHLLHWKGTLKGTWSHLLHWKGTLEGTLSHLLHWKGTLVGTWSHLLHWKGTLEGTLLCFIYHGASEGGIFLLHPPVHKCRAEHSINCIQYHHEGLILQAGFFSFQI